MRMVPHDFDGVDLARLRARRTVKWTLYGPDVLAACDALVAPSRYEAYGLAVHEALACGLPALVSEGAGVAERYPADLADLLLRDGADAREIAASLRAWRANAERARERVAAFSSELRARSWDDMAREIERLLERVA